jgi:hypothetical protein
VLCKAALLRGCPASWFLLPVLNRLQCRWKKTLQLQTATCESTNPTSTLKFRASAGGKLRLKAHRQDGRHPEFANEQRLGPTSRVLCCGKPNSSRRVLPEPVIAEPSPRIRAAVCAVPPLWKMDAQLGIDVLQQSTMGLWWDDREQCRNADTARARPLCHAGVEPLSARTITILQILRVHTIQTCAALGASHHVKDRGKICWY